MTTYGHMPLVYDCFLKLDKTDLFLLTVFIAKNITSHSLPKINLSGLLRVIKKVLHRKISEIVRS